MPFALVFIAVALIIAGFRGTQACLFSLLQQDASGQFIQWGGAILIIGGMGYIKALEPVSTALLALLLVVLFLGHSGVFTQAAAALQQNTAPASGTAAIAPAAGTTASSQAQTMRLSDPLGYGATLLAGSGIGSNPGIGTGGLY